MRNRLGFNYILTLRVDVFAERLTEKKFIDRLIAKGERAIAVPRLPSGEMGQFRSEDGHN